MKVLDMLSAGIANYIKGENIDRTYNAITLSHSLHAHFGQLEIYFTADEAQPHKYIIESTKWFMPFPLPFTRELLLTPGFDAPLPKLLAVHRACCLILSAVSGTGRLDGAGEPGALALVGAVCGVWGGGWQGGVMVRGDMMM